MKHILAVIGCWLMTLCSAILYASMPVHISVGKAAREGEEGRSRRMCIWQTALYNLNPLLHSRRFHLNELKSQAQTDLHMYTLTNTSTFTHTLIHINTLLVVTAIGLWSKCGRVNIFGKWHIITTSTTISTAATSLHQRNLIIFLDTTFSARCQSCNKGDNNNIVFATPFSSSDGLHVCLRVCMGLCEVVTSLVTTATAAFASHQYIYAMILQCFSAA